MRMSRCIFALLILVSITGYTQSSIEQAKDLYQQGKWHKAIPLVIDNKDAESTHLLLKIYLDSASFLSMNSLPGFEELNNTVFLISQSVTEKTFMGFNCRALGAYASGDFVTAKTLFEQAHEIIPTDKEVNYYLWAMDLLLGHEQFDQHPNLLKSLQLAPDWFQTHLELGVLYYNNGKLPEATSHLLHSLENKEDFLTRYYLGCVYSQAQDWEKAIIQLQKTLELRPDFGGCYFVLGSVQIYIGQVEYAVQNFHNAIRYAPAYYNYIENLKQFYPVLTSHDFTSKSTPVTGESILNKGITYCNEGNYYEADHWIHEGIRALNRETPKNIELILSAYNWSMVNLHLMGNHQSSNNNAFELLNLDLESHYLDTEKGTIYAYIAANYEQMGDINNALDYAIKSYKEVRNGPYANQYTAKSLLNLASLSFDAGRYAQCKSYLTELNQFEGDGLFYLQNMMTKVSLEVSLAIHEGQFKNALKKIDHAENTFDFSTSPNSIFFLEELRFKVYMASNAIIKADASLEKLNKLAGLEKKEIYYGHTIQSDIINYWHIKKDRKKALFILHNRLKEITEDIERNFPRMNEEGKSLAYKKNNEWLSRYFSTLYELNDQKLENYKVVNGMSFTNIFRSSISNNNNRIYGLAQSLNDQESLSTIDSIKSLKSALRQPELTPDVIKSHEASLAELEKNLFSKYHIPIAQEYYNIDKIENNLPKDDIVVNIVRFNEYNFKQQGFTDSAHYAFLIFGHNKKPEIRFLKDAETLENKLFNGYKNKIKHQIKDDESYENFYGILDDIILSQKKIWLIPDGVYHFINPNTLFVPKKDDYALNLAEFRTISKLTSASFKEESLEITAATVIGNPNFNETKEEIAKTLDSYHLHTFETTAFLDEQTSTREGSANFTPLPGTQKEIEAIHNLLTRSGISSTVISGNEAIEEIVTTHLDGNLIHFATHGTFAKLEESSVPNYDASLILAGANTGINESNLDGFLTAKEINNLLIPNTDLVVLSACETGTGISLDGQGVFGLQRAFINAGVNKLIMSLWKVDDKATSLLMTYFYEELMLTANPEQALKTAQKRLKKDYPSPYYWGAFVLVR